jgi:hypothetical protein
VEIGGGSRVSISRGDGNGACSDSVDNNP